MGDLVCPDCSARTFTEEVEITGTATRDWTATIRPRDGTMTIEVGKVEKDYLGMEAFESATSYLTCSCGWRGNADRLIQLGWDGEPVPKPIEGQLVLPPWPQSTSSALA